MKTFAIEINGILREFTNRFKAYYEQEFPDREISEPIDDFNILESFLFEDKEEIDDFLSSYAFELFGKSEQPDKIFLTQ